MTKYKTPDYRPYWMKAIEMFCLDGQPYRYVVPPNIPPIYPVVTAGHIPQDWPEYGSWGSDD